MTCELAITALAEPTRRAILDRLRGGALPVGAFARDLPVSRPAVSQHLRVLSDAGLLIATPDANRRLYAIAPQWADDLRRYLNDLRDNALSPDARAAHEKANA